MTKSYVGRAVLHLRNHSSYIGTAMLWYDSHSVHMCEMVALELANISRCFFIFQNFDYAQKWCKEQQSEKKKKKKNYVAS